MSIAKSKPSNLNPDKEYAPSYRLDIRSKFAKRLADKVDCILDYKNTALKALKCSTYHCNFPDYNDIAMDAIKEIKEIGLEKYPKLYDVTVPSTLNFMIANGLQVVDEHFVYNSGLEKSASH
jgi:hypothetical protein